jgi:hypothetical protein
VHFKPAGAIKFRNGTDNRLFIGNPEAWWRSAVIYGLPATPPMETMSFTGRLPLHGCTSSTPSLASTTPSESASPTATPHPANGSKDSNAKSPLFDVQFF